jgi:hypothetical protein
MDELATWLRAVLDEETARAVYRQWHAEDCETIPGPDGYSYPCECGVPEWMLRDIAAKRAIVDLHAVTRKQMWNEFGGPAEYEVECSQCGWVGVDVPACLTVRHLAAAMSGRDGYRPEWAPQ